MYTCVVMCISCRQTSKCTSNCDTRLGTAKYDHGGRGWAEKLTGERLLLPLQEDRQPDLRTGLSGICRNLLKMR